MDVITQNSPALHGWCGHGMGLTSYLVTGKNDILQKQTHQLNQQPIQD